MTAKKKATKKRAAKKKTSAKKAIHGATKTSKKAAAKKGSSKKAVAKKTAKKTAKKAVKKRAVKKTSKTQDKRIAKKNARIEKQRVIKAAQERNGKRLPDGNEGTRLEEKVGMIPVANLTGDPVYDDWIPCFLLGLRREKGVAAACREAGVGRSTAYAVRKKYKAFREAWIEAVELNTDELQQTAMHRAIYGWNEPLLFKGEIKAVKRVYSAPLTIFMLKKMRPDIFGDKEENKNLTPEEVAAALSEFANMARGTVGNKRNKKG